MAVTDEEITTTLTSLGQQRKQIDESIKSLEMERLSRIDERLFGVRGVPSQFGSSLEWKFGFLEIRHYPDDGWWLGSNEFERKVREKVGAITTHKATFADVEAVLRDLLKSFPAAVLEEIARG